MRSITKAFPKTQLNQVQVNGLLVCAATAGERVLGAIYKLRNGAFEAVPFDHPNIRRFDDPHKAQRHIEDCKL